MDTSEATKTLNEFCDLQPSTFILAYINSDPCRSIFWSVRGNIALKRTISFIHVRLSSTRGIAAAFTYFDLEPHIENSTT